VKAFFESADYRQNVIPDEEAFMDRNRCELLYTHEHSYGFNAVTFSSAWPTPHFFGCADL
jgi:hypothetical protein